jgi:ATP-dependent helicase/nuclease subunit B
MTTELIIAPPAAGKTTACIQRIQAVQKEHPLAQIWVLVPDRQKGVYFRTRLAAAGGGMAVTTGTFGDLYRDILERNGTFVPVASQALGHRLIQETVSAVHASGELTHYAAIRDKPGFLLALQDAFAELRGAVVRPERFLEYTRNSSPARYELALLYDRFLSRLRDLNWIDQEGQGWLAIDALASNPKAAAHLRLVVADGFTAFTGVRRQFLRLLGEQAGALLLTLPGKMGSDRSVHRHTLQVAEKLRTELSPELSEIDAPPHLPAFILHMEKHVLNPGACEKLETTPNAVMLEARSQSEEAREALRWIKDLNVRHHIPLSACALFASNLAVYQPLLRAAANEFGIKIHFSQPDPLAESPAVMALLALLTLPLEDYPTRTLLNTLHSPYFDFGLDAQDRENLEKVSQKVIIIIGREQWDDAWKRLEKTRARASEQLDDERRRKDITAGIDLPALRNSLEKFWALYSQIDLDRSLADWVAWLESLLAQLGFYERISSERDRQACTSLGVALKALMISESVAGKSSTNFAQFFSNLEGALKGSRVEESRESRHNALLVGRMVEARGSRFQAVALLGLAEGFFPVVENPDPFLGEELRKDLGLEPRLQREQVSIFYQAFTRSDTHLLLTRPYLSEGGERWEASPYWLAVQNLFTENAVLKVQPDTMRPQAEAASSQELLFWGVQQQELQYQADKQLSERWQMLAKAHAVLDARRARNARGMYEGSLEGVAVDLAERYSAEHVWSASRLEEYGNCPYWFLIHSTLELSAKTNPEPGLDAAQTGSIYHHILERVYEAVIKDHVLPLDILDEVAASVFRDAPQKFGFRPSALWEVEKAQSLEKLRQTLVALEEERNEWDPIEVESKFGISGAASLELAIGEQVIQVRGVIDRVDRNARGEIRVIDYKTGSSKLAPSDLKSGLRLQLPIYALAAQEALNLGQVVDGFYWTINAAKASSIKLSKVTSEDLEGPDAAYHVAKGHILRNISGIRSGDFQPKAPKGGCPDYCPAAQWCWRYQAGYKND